MHVAILGAGTMGHGIAQVAAMAGHKVSLRDVKADLVEDGLNVIKENLESGVDRGKVTEEEASVTLDRITGTTSLADAVADATFVVEAVPEDMDIKKATLTEVESHVSSDTVLASNTSSLSVTEMASALDERGRVIGVHFFNPVHLMNLVEIIVAEQTSNETLALAYEFLKGTGKTPIEVIDSPGFASSRLGVALGVEAIRMVQEGVASPNDIDQAMKFGYNHPMGPLKLTDIVGLDVRLDILEYLREELGERFRPPQLLKRKVRAGKLGKKTGEGFYIWDDGEVIGVSETGGAV